MKSWRDRSKQAAFVRGVNEERVAAGGKPLPTGLRVGKMLRDSGVKTLPFPSVLLQSLMLRAGLWK